MNVRQILIMGATEGLIAFRDANGWHDPHGGIFSAEVQRSLTAFAEGEIDMPRTNVGTRWERIHHGARVIVHFK